MYQLPVQYLLTPADNTTDNFNKFVDVIYVSATVSSYLAPFYIRTNCITSDDNLK
jgi:hypothetical protein